MGWRKKKKSRKRENLKSAPPAAAHWQRAVPLKEAQQLTGSVLGGLGGACAVGLPDLFTPLIWPLLLAIWCWPASAGMREDLVATIVAAEPCGGFTVRWASSSLTQVLAPALLQPLPARSRARPVAAPPATTAPKPTPKPAKKRARAAEEAPPKKASKTSKATTATAAAAAAAAPATGAAAAPPKPAKAARKASAESGAKGGSKSAGGGGGGGGVSAAAARSEARAAECCICLAGSPDVSTLCCGVPVHSACLTQWLASSTNSNCVQCRSALPHPSSAPTAPTPAPSPSITLRTVVPFGRYCGQTVQAMLQDASYVAWMERKAATLTPPLSDIYAFYRGPYRAQRAAEARAEELARAERARVRLQQLQEEEARRRAALEASQREAAAGGQQHAAAPSRSAPEPARGGLHCTARGCKGSRKGQCLKRLCGLCCRKDDPSSCVTHKVQADPHRAPTPQQ